MSHSKYNKRGKSLYIESWNPDAKRFINTCVLCGDRGYNPSIEEEGFVHPAPDKRDHVHSAIYDELTRSFKRLKLDELGRCEVCARNMDKK